jgi:hypothetical protein
MAVLIKVPDSPWSSQRIPLKGETFLFVFKFNTRDESWNLDIQTTLENPIISGIKIMPNQNLTFRQKYKTQLPSGNLWCIRSKNNFSPIGRENLGIDKTYELMWLTPEEEEEFGINGRIQL